MVKRKRLIGATTTEKSIVEPEEGIVDATKENPIAETTSSYPTFTAANLMFDLPRAPSQKIRS